MAVDPTSMKAGLAKTLMQLQEKEVIARGKRQPGVKEIRLTLTTAKEANFEYYTRNGFIVTEEVNIEKGEQGNLVKFSVALMEKVLWREGGSV